MPGAWRIEELTIAGAFTGISGPVSEFILDVAKVPVFKRLKIAQRRGAVPFPLAGAVRESPVQGFSTSAF
jgi:hypothetical protein